MLHVVQSVLIKPVSINVFNYSVDDYNEQKEIDSIIKDESNHTEM